MTLGQAFLLAFYLLFVPGLWRLINSETSR